MGVGVSRDIFLYAQGTTQPIGPPIIKVIMVEYKLWKREKTQGRKNGTSHKVRPSTFFFLFKYIYIEENLFSRFVSHPTLEQIEKIRCRVKNSTVNTWICTFTCKTYIHYITKMFDYKNFRILELVKK